jgi:hypothetical protein
MPTLASTARLRAVSAPTEAILAVTGTETIQGSDVLESLWTTQAGTPPEARPEAAFLKVVVGARYLAILYVRWPAAFFEDSIFSPPLLPRILTNPRTVCRCQPVASIISSSVVPFARCIIASTSAFLLVRSDFGLRASLPAGAGFFALLAFFARFAPLASFLGLASGLLAGASVASGRIAFQIRATAFFRSASLLTSVFPGMLFQICTKRLMGQSADSLPNAASESNCARSGLHSSASVAFG